jgi:excisionase family DNA binding protein
MLDIIPVILGIVLLIKGQFKIGNRYVAKTTGRMIGGLLILPSLITFCGSFMVGLTSYEITPDGEITFDLNNPIFTTLIMVQLVLLGVALVISAYLVWKSPTTPPAPTQSGAGLPPNAPWNIPNPFNTPAAPYNVPMTAAPPTAQAPSIMSVDEAAAYLRVTPQDILALIDGGKLPAARMGGNNYRIARSAIDDYVNGTL